MALGRPATAIASLLLFATVAGSAFAKGTLYRWVDDQRAPSATQTSAPAPASSTSAALHDTQCALRKEQLQSYQSADNIQGVPADGEMRAYTDAERGQLIESAQKAVTEACAS
jgi:hypothetical protein